ncbi:MAG: hypothetical protein AVDCRST_MAG73-2926, partial [uncultured Thermomicrobiales bacterium]
EAESGRTVRVRLGCRRHHRHDPDGDGRCPVSLRGRPQTGHRSLRLGTRGADRRRGTEPGRTRARSTLDWGPRRPDRTEAGPYRRHGADRGCAGSPFVRYRALAGLRPLRGDRRGRVRRHESGQHLDARQPLVHAQPRHGPLDRHLRHRPRPVGRGPRRDLDPDRHRLADHLPGAGAGAGGGDGAAGIAVAAGCPGRADRCGRSSRAGIGRGRGGAAGGDRRRRAADPGVLAPRLGVRRLRLHDGLCQHPFHGLRRRHGDARDDRGQRGCRHRGVQRDRHHRARPGRRPAAAIPGPGADLRPPRDRVPGPVRDAGGAAGLRLRRRARRLLDRDHPADRRNRRRPLRSQELRRHIRHHVHGDEPRFWDWGLARRRDLRRLRRVPGGAGGQRAGRLVGRGGGLLRPRSETGCAPGAGRDPGRAGPSWGSGLRGGGL